MAGGAFIIISFLPVIFVDFVVIVNEICSAKSFDKFFVMCDDDKLEVTLSLSRAYYPARNN